MVYIPKGSYKDLTNIKNYAEHTVEGILCFNQFCLCASYNDDVCIKMVGIFFLISDEYLLFIRTVVFIYFSYYFLYALPLMYQIIRNVFRIVHGIYLSRIPLF